MVHFQVIATAVALTIAVQAATIAPVTHASITRRESTDLSSLVVSRDLLKLKSPVVAMNVTRFEAPHSALSIIDKRANENLVLGVLAQSGAIATAVCGVAAFAAVIGAGACIAAGVYAAVVGIWALVLATKTSRRAFDDVNLNIHPGYVPRLGCNVGCQLAAASPEGEWTHFANVTSAGVVHNLHYFQSGRYRGIRAVSDLAATHSKRQIQVGVEFDQDSDKNWITSTYWEDESKKAFNSWNRDDTTWLAGAAGSYFIQNNAQLGCVDAGDSDGVAFQSLTLFDWQDVELQLSNDQISQYLPLCVNEDP
ncbi:hypothetical protein IFR05_007826 [Cadophora sp. M221]|nr:hypothetical protein IFR05_007826 [Cadophora sp. M221]